MPLIHYFMSRFFSVTLFVFVCRFVSGQGLQDSTLTLFLLKGTYYIQVPGGDIAKRFGWNSAISPSFTVKFSNNWLAGLDYNYMFGNQIKENGILDSIKTSGGQIINKYGEYANILMYERGFYAGLHIGHFFPFLGKNPNCGIIFSVGSGLLQHKIRIENDGNNAPQVLNDYKKGYDRLTNGLAINEFIGYQFLGNKQYFNFYFGFEFFQGWTKNRRDFNFDTRKKDDTLRHDYLYSFKAGWIIPFYKKALNKYYYY